MTESEQIFLTYFLKKIQEIKEKISIKCTIAILLCIFIFGFFIGKINMVSNSKYKDLINQNEETTREYQNIKAEYDNLLSLQNKEADMDNTIIKQGSSVTGSIKYPSKSQKEIDAENQVISLFAACWESYQANKFSADIDYKQIENIYKQYSNNNIISNLYAFCQSVEYFYLAELLEKPEYKNSGKEEAAKISPDYDGAYSNEIISYAKSVLGNEYSSLAAAAKKREDNYKNLSTQDKMDIVNYIYANSNKNANDVWKEVATKYGITETKVTAIYNDVNILSAVGEENNRAKYDSITEYDAILSNNGQEILVASSRNNLDSYLDGSIQETEVGNMFANGKLAHVENDTKVNILETKAGVVKVKILSGSYEGNIVWTFSEVIQKRQ